MAFMDSEEDGGISDDGKDKGLRERPLKWWPLVGPSRMENLTKLWKRALTGKHIPETFQRALEWWRERDGIWMISTGTVEVSKAI
jgi:hypothetical protein